MKKSDLDLVELSTSILVDDSNEHEFSNLHPGFLASKGIVPHEWKWKKDESSMNPSFFSIEYENGVRLLGDEDMLQVSQTQDLEIGKKCESCELVVKYIASVAPGVFKMAGMEWTIQAPLENPSEWITNRFFRPEVILEKWSNVRTIPLLRFEIDELLVTYRFSTAQRKIDDEASADEQIMLAVACRIGLSTFADDAELSGWLLEWLKHEEIMLSNLMSLMENENGMG